MIDILDYHKNFKGLTPPKELIALFNFDQRESNNESYSDGFELSIFSDDLLESCSTSEQFLNSVLPFANADAGGSVYALWIRDNNQNLEEAPVIIFGGKGGYHVVAENITALLQILLFDAEPMVSWDDVYYYKGQQQGSIQNNTFRNWALNTFNIKATSSADDIVKAAQTKHEEAFQNWMKSMK